MPYRCPRCGQYRNVRFDANRYEGRVLTSSYSAAEEPLERFVPRESIDGQRFSATALQAGASCCRDSHYDCSGYDPLRRDSFWPDFCHPRWLSCERLYSGARCRWDGLVP